MKSFICCITPHQDTTEYFQLIKEISLEFGPIESILNNTPWAPPINYQKEMKSDLKTSILILKRSLNIKEFVILKKYCMFYEHLTSIDYSRKFNLNPGYLDYNGMFLATHKPSVSRNREYLMDNIWQEKQYDFNNDYFYINTNTFSEYVASERISKLTEYFHKNSLIYRNPKYHLIQSPAANILYK